MISACISGESPKVVAIAAYTHQPVAIPLGVRARGKQRLSVHHVDLHLEPAAPQVGPHHVEQLLLERALNSFVPT